MKKHLHLTITIIIIMVLSPILIAGGNPSNSNKYLRQKMHESIKEGYRVSLSLKTVKQEFEDASKTPNLFSLSRTATAKTSNLAQSKVEFNTRVALYTLFFGNIQSKIRSLNSYNELDLDEQTAVDNLIEAARQKTEIEMSGELHYIELCRPRKLGDLWDVRCIIYMDSKAFLAAIKQNMEDVKKKLKNDAALIDQLIDSTPEQLQNETE